ncbi:MAG: 1-phosphofructokinase family hexose kinase [Candidatus Firestonebacteria bacterium]
MKKILSIGLNNVLQKVLVFKDIKYGEVNRAKSLYESASGKGINVARALNILGANVMGTGFIGGNSGKLILNYLNKEKIKSDFVMTESNTRACITLLDLERHTSTELIEPSNRIKKSEISNFMKKLKVLLKKTNRLTISGTLPKGVPDEMYFNIIKIANKLGVLSFVDIWGSPGLKAIKANPFLLKMNIEEFKKTFKTNNVRLKISELLKTGIKWVVVTSGKDGSIIASGNNIYKAVAPKVKPINAIGAGDAFLAGFLYALSKNYDKIDIIKFATATGTASALKIAPADCNKKDIEKLFKKVRIKIQ